MLSTLHALFELKLRLFKEDLLLSPCYRRENRVPDKIRDFPKVTQLIISRSRFKLRLPIKAAFLIPKRYLVPLKGRQRNRYSVSWTRLENKPGKPDLLCNVIKNRLCLMPTEVNGLCCKIWACGLSSLRQDTGLEISQTLEAKVEVSRLSSA